MFLWGIPSVENQVRFQVVAKLIWLLKKNFPEFTSSVYRRDHFTAPFYYHAFCDYDRGEECAFYKKYNPQCCSYPFTVEELAQYRECIKELVKVGTCWNAVSMPFGMFKGGIYTCRTNGQGKLKFDLNFEEFKQFLDYQKLKQGIFE